MSEPFVIALDQGTSGCRAVAVDATGRVRARQSISISPRRQSAGMSEYTAEELWQTQSDVLTRLLDEIGPEQAVSLAVCSQRSTIVLWDKITGKSLAPVLTWEDGRAQQEADQAPLSQADIHGQTGLFKTPYFSAPKITWCLANFPQAKRAAQAGTLLVAPVASYFIWKLTQGKVFAADPSLAQRTLLWDLHTLTWNQQLCQAFGVPLACLPAVLPTAADYGTFTYKGRQIPITVCAADQQAALTYHQISKGQTHINYGTGAFVLQHTGEKVIILPGLLSSVACGSLTKPQFLLEGPVFAAGSVLQWLQAQGILPPGIDVDGLCRLSQQPVRFLPAFGGVGAPYWNYQVSPVIENLSPRTRGADFVAGAMQGIAHLVTDIINYMRQNGQSVSKVQVSGGMAQCNYLLQFQADLLQLPVEVCSETDSTVLGTALLAARFAGWKVDSWNPVREVISPRSAAADIQPLRVAWQQMLERTLQRKCV